MIGRDLALSQNSEANRECGSPEQGCRMQARIA
jgi:hypothetical protein